MRRSRRFWRRDKTAALEGAHRALRLAPGNPVTHYWAATVSGAALSMGDMLTHIEMAVRLQPYSLFFQTWRAVCLFWAGQVDAAIRHLHDILAFEPRDFLANYWLGHIAALSRTVRRGARGRGPGLRRIRHHQSARRARMRGSQGGTRRGRRIHPRNAHRQGAHGIRRTLETGRHSRRARPAATGGTVTPARTA